MEFIFVLIEILQTSRDSEDNFSESEILENHPPGFVFEFFFQGFFVSKQVI